MGVLRQDWEGICRTKAGVDQAPELILDLRLYTASLIKNLLYTANIPHFKSCKCFRKQVIKRTAENLGDEDQEDITMLALALDFSQLCEEVEASAAILEQRKRVALLHQRQQQQQQAVPTAAAQPSHATSLGAGDKAAAGTLGAFPSPNMDAASLQATETEPVMVTHGGTSRVGGGCVGGASGSGSGAAAGSGIGLEDLRDSFLAEMRPLQFMEKAILPSHFYKWVVRRVKKGLFSKREGLSSHAGQSTVQLSCFVLQYTATT